MVKLKTSSLICPAHKTYFFNHSYPGKKLNINMTILQDRLNNN